MRTQTKHHSPHNLNLTKIAVHDSLQRRKKRHLSLHHAKNKGTTQRNSKTMTNESRSSTRTSGQIDGD